MVGVSPAKNPLPSLPLAWHLTAVLLGFGALYRLLLQWDMRQELLNPPPFSTVSALWVHAWRDVVLAIGLGLLVAIAGKFTPPRRSLRIVAIVLWCLPLALIGAWYQAHLRLLTSLHIGLTWGILLESFGGGQWWSLMDNAHWRDIVFAATPVALWLASVALDRRYVRVRFGILAGSAAVVWVVGLLPGYLPDEFPSETGASPAVFTVVDFWQHRHEVADSDESPNISGNQGVGPKTAAKNVDEDGAPMPAGASMADATTVTDDEPNSAAPLAAGLRLTDPRVSDLPIPMKDLPKGAVKNWNVVWVIMESTGMRYFTGETTKGIETMPYLRSLAKDGWFLSHHRSPSNSSATSIFAQMSGLYPSPTIKMFSVQKDNYVPTLFSLLPTQYERFLVTPGKLSYFFPRYFLKHGGLEDLKGYEELPINKGGDELGLCKDEIETVSYFLSRLHKAKAPFAAVYYSFVAHWQYADYGPQYRRFAPNRPMDRYHNNLYLLDSQIKRIVEQLKQDGQLESTILVFAGDHGEAFGQHEHNWAHSRASFEENFATPAILWQPKVFSPKVDTRETLHIDLAPTVLDALGIPTDDALLQGESLFQRQLRRKVAFFWSNIGTVTAIRAGIKLNWALAEKRCWAFDLAKDPSERKPLTCDKFGDLLAIVKDYRDTQRAALPAYSAAAQKGEPYQGHRHPTQVAPAVDKSK